MGKGTPSLDSPKTRRRVKRILREGREIQGTCWVWTRARNAKGYGIWRIRRRWYKVHRLSAWLYLDFDLDEGWDIHHTCRNPPCFNPRHLEAREHDSIH